MMMRMKSETGDVVIRSGTAALRGMVSVPERSLGIVLFAHGSGSGRLSPRNQFVASALQEAGLATLLFDLLTEREAEERANVFDISLLAERLLDAVRWCGSDPRVLGLPVGLFGASTGAAAALVAAAREPRIGAVVSRGGRPDLAEASLASVKAPTLLIVGGDDVAVLEMNRSALAMLRCEKRLEIVPGAGHLFEEPGSLERVADLAASWFTGHLARGASQ